jgi:ABC-type glycerol-3-phosphate transport system permease component
MEQPNPAAQTLKFVAIIAMIVAVGYPFLLAIGTSLSSKAELAANGGYVLFPSHPTLEAYRVVLSGGVITRAAIVSVGVTVIGTALSLLCTIALAYGLSRPRTFAGKPLLLIVVGTFLFTPGIIPNYLVVQDDRADPAQRVQHHRGARVLPGHPRRAARGGPPGRRR